MGKGSTKELTVVVPEENRDIVMALLGNIGYEGFWEDEEGFKAYLPEDQFDKATLDEVLTGIGVQEEKYSIQDLADQNWNQSWESHFPPVRVGNQVQIVAGFHEVLPEFAHTIRITPKMSFGTGHHETTRLMIQGMDSIPFQNKTVLDMGCGTGVLAILAKMMGATDVTAIDIDEWGYKNATDNVAENGCEDIVVIQGDAAVIPSKTYDVILANINRNVLLQDTTVYASHLNETGFLLMSGFRPEDESLIVEVTEREKLSVLRKSRDGDWMAILFQK